MFQRITSLENRLFEDHAGTYRASLIRQLSEERARLAAYLQQASSTEQKEQRRNTLWQCAALEYAQAVIDAVWKIPKKGGDGKYSKQRQSPPVRIQGQRIAKGYCGAALSVLLRKLVADMRQAAPFPH